MRCAHTPHVAIWDPATLQGHIMRPTWERLGKAMSTASLSVPSAGLTMDAASVFAPSTESDWGADSAQTCGSCGVSPCW
jgi:hypothetical protein